MTTIFFDSIMITLALSCIWQLIAAIDAEEWLHGM